MWRWKKKPVDEATLRAQLRRARAKVEYQLSIMQAGPASRAAGWRHRFKHYADELAETLRKIDESLANLRPDDASRS